MAGGGKDLWVVANFKSNFNLAQALDWVSQVGSKLERKPNLKVVVCPDFVALEEVKKAIQVGSFPLMVGAQDLSPYPEGAHTGEEASTQLKELVDLVILGHSERRENFGETDAQVAQKLDQAQREGIISLVCVQGANTPIPKGCKLVAFEPVFAIGTGHADTPKDTVLVAQNLKQKYGQSLEVLYGGSVTSENVKAFLEKEELNGVLVGTASLNPQEFLKIVEVSYEI